MAHPSLGSAAGLCLSTVALFIGLDRLSDNSFFTHLATGRIIVDDWHIPRSDPFTFTAQGEPWVVQSWLASLLYGVVDEVAGLGGLRILTAMFVVGLFGLIWRLSRPAESLLLRVGLGGLVLGIGATYWSERPLLIGLLGLAAVVLVGEGGLDPRWLLPIGWVWVNSHGSFPLGLAYLLVALVGRRLDREAAGTEMRALRWLAGGIALAAVNPLGPRLLAFPVELLQKQDILRHVVEWQSPAFQSWPNRIFLVQVVLAVLALVRVPSYRRGLLVAVFVAAALLGARNIPVASLVLVPLLAAAVPAVGTLRSGARSALAPVLGAVAVAGLAGVAIVRMGQPDLRLDSYPIAALDLLEERGLDLETARLAAPDPVGNLLELRLGPGERVFFDDRFDMFPEAVSGDALDLIFVGPQSRDVLRRWDIDLVLWGSEHPLVAVLRADSDWREVDQPDGDWVLLCRRDVPGLQPLGC